MDPITALGAAVNVLTIVQLSAEVSAILFKYFKDVKKAQDDIARLQNQVNNTHSILTRLNELVNSPDGHRLTASASLVNALNDCKTQLETIKKRLPVLNKQGPGNDKDGLRMEIKTWFSKKAVHIKWPFASKEINDLIAGLQQTTEILFQALQIDETRVVIQIDKKIAINQLPYARAAAFDSQEDEHVSQCLNGTRETLLNDIYEWAIRPGKCIYWLQGMAGTGKSTISRTIAQRFHDNRQLGASFFFKRGEAQRGNAQFLFSTIATDLSRVIPEIQTSVADAVSQDPQISTRRLNEQFKKLILDPLSQLQPKPEIPVFVIVLDALDECNRDDDVRIIVELLSQIKQIKGLHIRVFVTSRPEHPILQSFKKMKDSHKDVALHDIPKAVIDQDISVFFTDSFSRMRREYAYEDNWPGISTIQQLVHTASPLFIFAATVCRIISDGVLGDPKDQLERVIQYSDQEGTKLDATYRPVLDRLLLDPDNPCKQRSGFQKAEILEDFRIIVGSIIVLYEPQSILSLSNLLAIKTSKIKSKLKWLQAVIRVPEDNKPVRIFHLSFSDYLLQDSGAEKALHNNSRDSEFWIDKKQAHQRLANSCIRLISSLKEDICSVTIPGTLVTDIRRSRVEKCLPSEIQYACLYWIQHLQRSGVQLQDNNYIHQFLQNHLLHWLEALSWMQKISEGILEIISLESIIVAANCPSLYAFIYDIKRFVLYNRATIEKAPLQVYSSALIFTPVMSIVRKQFSDGIPGWIRKGPEVEANWSPTLQTLEGHSASVKAVVFSPDGKQLASGSNDKTVRIWDAATGAALQTLEGHSRWVNAVVFSPDGKQLASGSNDKTVRIWDTATGAALQTLKGHSDSINTVVFSPDGKQLASGSSDQTVRIWDAATGAALQILEGHSASVNAVVFSPDGKQLASSSDDTTVRIWDTATGAALQTLKGHSSWVNAVVFSPDGKQLASGSDDETVRIWDAATGAALQTLKGHSSWVNAVVFSPDGKQLASSSNDKTVQIWDVATGAALQTLEGHSRWVKAVVFSPNGKQLASGSDDETVRIWDVATGAALQTLKGHSAFVNTVVFSPNGKQLASGSGDETVRIWDTATGAALQTLEGHSAFINAVVFSPDGKQLVSGSNDKTVRIWDAAIGAALQTFEINTIVNMLSYSSDGSIVTDHGRLDAISHNAALSLSLSPRSPQPVAFRPNIFVQDKWIVHRENRMLWLPLDYRHSCSAVHENIVCLGQRSGRVYIIEFLFS